MASDKKNIEIKLFTDERTYISRVVQIKTGHEEILDEHIEDFKRDWPLSSKATKARIEVGEYK